MTTREAVRLAYFAAAGTITAWMLAGAAFLMVSTAWTS